MCQPKAVTPRVRRCYILASHSLLSLSSCRRCLVVLDSCIYLCLRASSTSLLNCARRVLRCCCHRSLLRVLAPCLVAVDRRFISAVHDSCACSPATTDSTTTRTSSSTTNDPNDGYNVRSACCRTCLRAATRYDLQTLAVCFDDASAA